MGWQRVVDANGERLDLLSALSLTMGGRGLDGGAPNQFASESRWTVFWKLCRELASIR